MRVLVVEDEKKIASFIRKGLTEVGFNALLTKNNLQPIPAASPAIEMPVCTLGPQAAASAGGRGRSK